MPRPRREEFILDVRRSAKMLQQPNVDTDSDAMDTDAISKILQRAGLWLTPKVVALYDPDDFETSSEEQRTHLRLAVYEFRKIAEQVAPHEPATVEQFGQGVYAFRELIKVLGSMVRDEWLRAIDALESQTEEWSVKAAWPTKRSSKNMSESFIGPYEATQLLIFAAPNLYVLDPVARFVPQAQGAFDFAIQPSYFSTSMYRDDKGIWYARLEKSSGSANARRAKWNRDTFYNCIEQLKAIA